MLVLPISFTIGRVMCLIHFFVVFVPKVFKFLQSLSIPRKPVGTPYLGTDYAVKSISNRGKKGLIISFNARVR